MGRFENALALAFGFEGGVADDPNDHGGLTNLGVTQATWDSYCHIIGLPHSSVRGISHEQAKAVYQKLFWDESHAGAADSPLAECIFDFAVNSGPGRAVKTLQQVVGVSADGVFGPATTKAVKRHNPKSLALEYLVARAAFFHRIAVGDQHKFLKGWLRRVDTLRAYVERHAW